MSKRLFQSDERDREQFLNRIQNSPTTSSFPKSPSDLFPRRLSLSQDAQPMNRGMKLTKNQPPPLETRSRSNSKSNGKGKEPMGSSSQTVHSSTFGSEHYVPHYNGTSHYISHGAPRPATAGGNMNGRSKVRGSLLVAASDALSFKFGRRRPSIRQPPMSIILPDVIEIKAPRADEEDEERNRLREMAAQSLGLGPYMVTGETQSRQDSATDEDEEDRRHLQDSAEGRRLGVVRNPESASTNGRRSPHTSSVSVIIPIQQPQPIRVGRYRSGSVPAGHSPSNSMTIAPIPPFPSTVGSLASFRQSGGVYPKYYPPSSLRIFALSKNWKNRYLILSSPATLVTRNQSPAVSYLHLFKSSNSEDKELERLEINEDSVVFVAEEEVGGKRHVIKVGGADVGAMKKEYTHEEGGHIMWLLQISDQADAQTWISNIKNAILGQRTVRAGLLPALSLGNNEPRGDMDVMLSIRAQGLITSPTSPTSPTFRPSQNSSPIPFSQTDTNPNYASSISSHSARSQSTVPKTSPSTAVSALKGLFTNTGRPRSASRAASIDSERQQEREGNEDSFTSMGSNLLSMLRSSTPDTQSINTVHTSPVIRNNLPFSGPINPMERRIDRKIMPKHQTVQWSNSEPTASSSKDRVSRGFSLGALSLQPPPRKRWTSSGPTGSSAQSTHSQDTPMAESSRRVSFSASVASTERAEPAPLIAGFSFGTPEQKPRAPSIQSVSTFASGENGVSVDRSSSSTKTSSGTRSVRRWSRQGIIPNRSNPPSDPPPPIPHPYAADQHSGRGSSQSSQKSIVSGLPSFSKRQSGSSVRSINSFSTTYSHPASISSNMHPPTTRTSTSTRSSMPPPRPAPTSALPPAPTEANQDSNDDVLKSLELVAGSPTKSSFRSSVHRPFRSSMTAPKPPPSTNLPPRPDEPEYKNHHRRSSSGSGVNGITHTKLETIPASPIPPSKVTNPFPPPVGPLPPTPSVSPPTSPTQPIPQRIPPPKRSTSIKQRLRILSAPSPSGNQYQGKLPLSRPTTSGNMTSSSFMTTSPPQTPIAEKITMFQNDPSFLQMHTPVIPSLPPPAALLPTPPSRDEIADFTELPPPPRRGSKQLLESEMPKNILTHALSDVRALATEVHTVPNRLSLSRPGSAMSNHSDLSEVVLELDWESPKDELAPPLEGLPIEKHHSTVEPRHLSLSRPGSVVSLGIVTM